MLVIQRCKRLPVQPLTLRWKQTDAKKDEIYVVKLFDGRKSKEMERMCKENFQTTKPCPELNFSSGKLVDLIKKISARSQINTAELLKKMKISERATKIKDEFIIPKFNENLNLELLKRKLNEFKISEETKQYLAEVPKKTLDFSQAVVCRAHQQWQIFLKSEVRMKIERILIFVWQTTVKLSNDVYKFIYECYFTKPVKRN